MLSVTVGCGVAEKELICSCNIAGRFQGIAILKRSGRSSLCSQDASEGAVDGKSP